jgi:pyrroline-5-carboxylate reductase
MRSMTLKITFVGGGNMASALIGGLLADRDASFTIRVIEPFEAQRRSLTERWGVLEVFEAPVPAAFDSADVVVLAVKPQQMREVAHSISSLLGGQLVISVAAGIRSHDLSRWLGGHRRIVRTMPNTPALIGRGVTGLAILEPGRTEDCGIAERILGAVGEIVWVEDEHLLDAVTAVSGSGPAYVFRVMEAMEAAGVALGLDAEQARRLTIATFVGAAELASRSGESPSRLRERVTSKGGTTAAALAVMESRDLSGLFAEALAAAARRGEEMGREFGAS